MLCAGLTTYAALTASGVDPGQWIVVSGAGGGLGHIGCQLARRGMRYRVIGIDAGSKEQLARESGAEEFVDIDAFKDDDKGLIAKVKAITGGRGAKAVLVCTASNSAYTQALEMLAPRGTLVCIGVPEGESKAISNAFPSKLVFAEYRIVGVAVGNQREASEVMELAAKGEVKPSFRVEQIEKLTEVFQEMKEGKIMGRVVIDLQS